MRSVGVPADGKGLLLTMLPHVVLQGKPTPPFRYWDKGDMAVIGRKAAVAKIGRLHFTGWFAWLMWLFVHLMFLVGFENRLLVFIQWAWNYFTPTAARGSLQASRAPLR